MDKVKCKSFIEKAISLIKANRKYLIEKAVNLLGVFFFGFLAYNMLVDFIVSHRPSSLILLIMESIVIYFFLTRDIPKQTSMRFYDWFIALVCTYLPLLLRAAPGFSDVTFLLYLQLSGTIVSTFAVLSLNSSFGMVAANRGIKKKGLYKYVRHPIYSGYLATYTGFIFQNMCFWNGVILFSVFALLVLRVFSEEKFLAKDPAYVEYMTQTRWRLIPYMF